jgi:hypothetical protein
LQIGNFFRMIFAIIFLTSNNSVEKIRVFFFFFF